MRLAAPDKRKAVVPANHSLEEDSVKSLPVSQHMLELEADSRKSVASSASQVTGQGRSSAILGSPGVSTLTMADDPVQESKVRSLHACQLLVHLSAIK